MKEQDLAKKIVRELDHGSASLDRHTVARLQTAREAAMTQYRAHQSVHSLTLANHGLSLNHGRDWISQHRLWLPIAVLVIGLTAIAYWQTSLQDDDLVDVDASLLASELPVHAFVDHRLSTWLESSKQ